MTDIAQCSTALHTRTKPDRSYTFEAAIRIPLFKQELYIYCHRNATSWTVALSVYITLTYQLAM